MCTCALLMYTCTSLHQHLLNDSMATSTDWLGVQVDQTSISFHLCLVLVNHEIPYLFHHHAGCEIDALQTSPPCSDVDTRISMYTCIYMTTTLVCYVCVYTCTEFMNIHVS